MADLASAVGTGLFNNEMTEEEISSRLSKLRYDKVICLMDSDIDGCLDFNTLISTTEGNKTIMELSESNKTYIGYAMDNNKAVEVPLLNPRVTKHVDELIEIELENGIIERCTLDHPIMLSDGSYVAAQNLTIDMELMYK